ncbi:hypothetical protein [Winogradskya humida]|uniref:Uncharacterized protein n=1 Tax=Winogradskya humida TaxID=113566 RepID=A0ABQ3ZGX1_9ACTN|nr:hypothetical protein [Actinoplanes humidus]GIE17825.1 hypothetical protein Ahu01nite_009270 [Actinoplanes humidus]
MYLLPTQEPERSRFADASAEVGRALLIGLAATGAAWAPGAMMPPVAPLTRSPKTRPAPVPEPIAAGPRQPSLLRLLFGRLAG